MTVREMELELDVSAAAGEPATIAATAYLPDPATLGPQPVAIFGVPGGGYGRFYYDLPFGEGRSYSQAAYHSGRGFVFVAFDPLGVGDSSPGLAGRVDIALYAASYDAAARQVRARLEAGTLAAGFPALPALTVFGIGQSLGGALSIAAQGRHRTFDGVGVLGFSPTALRIVQPDADASPLPNTPEAQQNPVRDWRYPWFWDDVPDEIVQADLGFGYPERRAPAPRWGSLTMPIPAVHQATANQYLLADALRIEVPVLLACGEREVVVDPHGEPANYRASRDIRLTIVPRMAHMHNFCSTRAVMWDCIEDWARRVARG